jgi:hemerythrin-like domain-containing protein
MDQIQPIKRSAALQPLSREHHDGLLFVWKIRQGLKNGTPIERLADYAGWYWIHHIRPHFFQEEKILLPLMDDQLLADRMKNEHDTIREMMIELDRDPQRSELTGLADLVEKHIRFEEREFFQVLEEKLDAEQFKYVQEQVEKHPLNCDSESSWEEAFWLNR